MNTPDDEEDGLDPEEGAAAVVAPELIDRDARWTKPSTMARPVSTPSTEVSGCVGQVGNPQVYMG